MPSVTEERVDAFAHCPVPRCEGSTQEPIKATRRESSRTYREMGGQGPGVESSWVDFVADEKDRDCPHCGHLRDISDQARKSYAPLSGHDPMGLLGVPNFSAQKQAQLKTEAEQGEVAKLRAELAELKEKMATSEVG